MRDHEHRLTLGQVLRRTLTVTVVNTVALLIAAWIMPSFSIDSGGDALLAGFVLGLVDGVLWPMLSVLIVPLSVLTLGLGAILLNALFVLLVLDALPGITLDGFGPAVVLVVLLSILTTLVSTVLSVDDDAWFDRRMAAATRRRAKDVPHSDVPGFAFVQIDGLAAAVLRRAIASGDAPHLSRLVHDGTHTLVDWETDWSSQTGVSQCGILHGSNADMPAFRWVEKDTGLVVVSNHPKSAAEIEARHSDGHGLLAHHGSSYGNLFSGDAERAVLTMSVVGKKKEGRIGAGYGRYFSHPYHAVRTAVSFVTEVFRERRAARDQIRRGVEPRVSRSWTYAFLRSFTTVISRDVSVQGILEDISEGRAAIYVDFLGYDEVSHHSGPERADTLAVLRDLDRQIARIHRSFQWAPRPYHLVVLSDHGQTQGAPFEQRAGESLAAVVERLVGQVSTGQADADEEKGRTESTAMFRAARGKVKDEEAATTGTMVLASGNLALIYLMSEKRRLTLEEIDERHPQLVAGLVEHPAIGFVLARSAARGAVVIGRSGRHWLDEGVVDGDDPLVPFGESAAAKVRRVDGFPHVADLMVNSVIDPATDEVAAFEHQVGSHGGLGGPQTHPFLLHPASLSAPAEPIVGAVGIHRQLKTWMVEAGQPVARPWLDAPSP